MGDTTCYCTRRTFDALYGTPVASPEVDFARQLFTIGLQLEETVATTLCLRQLLDDTEERIHTWPTIVSPYDDAIVHRAISYFRTAHATAAKHAAKVHKRSLKYAKHKRQRDRQRELEQMIATIGIVR